MRPDLGTILLCGVPGLIVWAIGVILVFARAFPGRRKSPLGLRLTLAGIGLAVLGWIVAVVVAALAVDLWPVAVVVVVAVGWQPVLFFWLATRRRVTREESS
jgi:Flp pilus assembly protein TadB